MERKPQNDGHSDDDTLEDLVNENLLIDAERRYGTAEDYKPEVHSDDEDVDYETRTHGANRRI